MTDARNDAPDRDDGDQQTAGSSYNLPDHLQRCPACDMPLTEQMDSCPFCGDILFRTLRHGTFTPRKSGLRKLFAFIVIALVLLTLLTFLLLQCRHIGPFLSA